MAFINTGATSFIAGIAQNKGIDQAIENCNSQPSRHANKNIGRKHSEFP
jgi:hypothetical protein